jgi:hypothetical protein
MARKPLTVRSALDDLRRVDANLKALVYAPWALSLLLVVFVREKAPVYEVGDWLRFGLFVATMPWLGRLARHLVQQQRPPAEAALEQLLRSPGRLDELQRMVCQPRYRQVELGERVRAAMVRAAIAAQRREEDRQLRRERQEATERAAARRTAVPV